MYIPKEQVIKEVTDEYLDALDVTNLPEVSEMVGQLYTGTNERLRTLNAGMPKGMTYRMTEHHYQLSGCQVAGQGRGDCPDPVQRPAQHLRPASPRNLPEIRAQSGAVLASGRRSGPDYPANAPRGIGKGHPGGQDDTQKHGANQAEDTEPGPCAGG